MRHALNRRELLAGLGGAGLASLGLEAITFLLEPAARTTS